jgi:hypothetical protein
VRVLLYPLILLSLGCSHQPLKFPEGSGLYPFATYQHQVKIKMLQPPRAFAMRGVVAYTPEAIKVVGLSGFGTTVFRIDENLKSGEIKKEFYLDAIRDHQDQFMGFYKLVREIVTAPKGITDFQRGNAHFVVSEPDENGIYCQVHVDHPQFALDIEVTDYDL